MTTFKLASVALLMAAAVCAGAVWTVTDLNPAGSASSYALGGYGANQVGYANLGDNLGDRPSLWSGTAGSWVDLSPAGRDESFANGAWGAIQVGFVDFGSGNHAGLWTGTAGSWVDLNPHGSTFSEATGASGINQVGYSVLADGNFHAGLWSGTANTWVDLNPSGSNESYANGAWGSTEVGYAFIPSAGQYDAGLWSGTAGSWVDLSPVGSAFSVAAGASSTNQVGYVFLADGNAHASLWSGTAASWVDLSPAGSNFSEAYGASGANQVGYAVLADGFSHAGLWSSTAASWVDLSPPGFYNTYARAITTDGANDSIVGYGTELASGQIHALLWTQPTGASAVDPDSYQIIRGSLSSGTLSSLFSVDGDALSVKSGAIAFSSDFPTQVVIVGTSPTPNPSRLMLSVTAKVQLQNIRQTIELYDFVAQAYVSVDLSAATLGYQTIVATGLNPSRFVDPGTNHVQARIKYKGTKTLPLSSFLTSLDQAIWWIAP